MARILGIAGSTRKASINAALLRAAALCAPAGTEVEIASIAGIPLYDGDLEAEGTPEAVVALKERVVAADGLLLVSPEYNHSVPGTLKNAVDWLSRPGKGGSRIFADKPTALLGASTGIGGTRFGQTAWLPVLHAVGARTWSGAQLYVGGPTFDAEGRPTDEKTAKLLTEFMAGFARFVAG